MKKKILMTLVLSLALQASVMAQTPSQNSQLNAAIRKYKIGNYAGCLQDMETYVKKDPSNAVAHYYIAISYAQANNKEKAIEAYDKAISLKSNPIVTQYATTGKRCLETPEQCKDTENVSDLDKFVQQPFGDGLSKKVKDEIETKRLDALKNDINKNKDIDTYEFHKFNKSENKLPSNDEIVNALKVLEKAGFTNLVQQNTQPSNTLQQAQNDNPLQMNYSNPQANPEFAKIMNDPQIMAQNQQMQQLQMMMGNGNNNNNQNNFMNMLPYMMAQNGKSSNMSPQLIQSMLMNSMMPSFDFDTNKDKN